MPNAARIIIDVSAGVIPGGEPDVRRRYTVSADEWSEAEDAGTGGTLLAEVNGRAQGYAALLMLQPDRYNWVKVDWLWL